MGGDAPQLRRPRDAAGMIAARVSHDAPRGCLVVQAQHRVDGPAGLEGARLLQVFALEEELATRDLVHCAARQDLKGREEGGSWRGGRGVGRASWGQPR